MGRVEKQAPPRSFSVIFFRAGDKKGVIKINIKPFNGGGREPCRICLPKIKIQKGNSVFLLTDSAYCVILPVTGREGNENHNSARHLR